MVNRHDRMVNRHVFTCIPYQNFVRIIKQIVNDDKSKFYYVSCRSHVCMADGHVFTLYNKFVRIIKQIVNDDKSKLYLVSCGDFFAFVFGYQSTYAINAHSKKKYKKNNMIQFVGAL